MNLLFLRRRSSMPVIVLQIARILKEGTYVGVSQSDQSIGTVVVLQGNDLLAIVGVVLSTFLHEELERRSSRIRDLMRVKQGLDVPAGHESILC